MNTYIATFFSHFGAVRYVNLLKQQNIVGKMKPVPRALSSNCGTCVEYVAVNFMPDGAVLDEIEQIVAVEKENYREMYKAEGL